MTSAVDYLAAEDTFADVDIVMGLGEANSMLKILESRESAMRPES